MKIKKSDTTFHLEILSNQNNIFLFFDLKSKMKIKKYDTTLDVETLSNQNSNMIFLLFALKSKMKIRKPPLSWMSILNLGISFSKLTCGVGWTLKRKI